MVSVRLIFELWPGAYEERITLWHTHSPDEAIERAEADAVDYCDGIDATYCGLAQSFRLFEGPEDGAEIFSLIRESELVPSDYLDRFFDAGTERQQRSTDGD